MPQSGKLPVLNLLTGKKSAFSPHIGATGYTDSREIWHEKGPLCHTKFHANQFTGLGTWPPK